MVANCHFTPKKDGMMVCIVLQFHRSWLGDSVISLPFFRADLTRFRCHSSGRRKKYHFWFFLTKQLEWSHVWLGEWSCDRKCNQKQQTISPQPKNQVRLLLGPYWNKKKSKFKRVRTCRKGKHSHCYRWFHSWIVEVRFLKHNRHSESFSRETW